MKKTAKMCEIEERIGEPLGDYLRREYQETLNILEELN